jgi:hypothetical protein
VVGYMPEHWCRRLKRIPTSLHARAFEPSRCTFHSKPRGITSQTSFATTHTARFRTPNQHPQPCISPSETRLQVANAKPQRTRSDLALLIFGQTKPLTSSNYPYPLSLPNLPHSSISPQLMSQLYHQTISTHATSGSCQTKPRPKHDSFPPARPTHR